MAGIAVVAVLVFLVPWPPVRVALALDAPWRPPCLVVARGAVLSPSMGLVAFLPLDPAASLAAPMLRRVILPCGLVAVALAGVLVPVDNAVVEAGVSLVGIAILMASLSDVIVVAMSLMKSSMVLQAEILDAGGIKTVCKVTTWLLLILTGVALGPNPTR